MKEFKSINDIKLEDIMEYCQENKKVKWLKELAQETEKRTKRSTITVSGDNGEPIEREVEEEVEQPISFITLRARFVDEFMPEIKKGAKKKPTFRDLIAAMEE